MCIRGAVAFESFEHQLLDAHTQTPGRIQKVDPLIWDPSYYRVLYRNPVTGSTFWILPGVWVNKSSCKT